MGEVIGILLGLAVASGVYCAVWRQSKGRSWVRGRSLCDGCDTSLRWWCLVPVLSFVLQGGRARCCGQKLSGWMLVVELAGALAGYAVVRNYQADGLFLGLWVLFVVLVMLWVMAEDAITHTIDVRLMGVVTALGLLLHFSVQAVLAVGIGMAFFGVQYLLTRGKGIGSGDIWLGAAMGVLLGSPISVGVAIGIGYILGSVHAIVLLMAGHDRKTRLPLGAYLALGVIILHAAKPVVYALLG